ncbi:MAG TPA: hypothetical protein VEU97_02875, partial [Ktedonobacteraceae bacterium]|nr:hypothetical protein [Ktedonobacteraceae bacterium]
RVPTPPSTKHVNVLRPGITLLVRSSLLYRCLRQLKGMDVQDGSRGPEAARSILYIHSLKLPEAAIQQGRSN